MTYSSKMENSDLCLRVREVFGIDEVFLTDSEITSPIIKTKFNQYLQSYLKDLGDVEITEENEINLLDVAQVYYTCYHLCFGMDVRLPNKMENVNTKTTLQSIDWAAKAAEMLKNCDEMLDDILEEEGFVTISMATIIDISDESPYPNELV